MLDICLMEMQLQILVLQQLIHGKIKNLVKDKKKQNGIELFFFGRLAEIASEYLKKGSQVYVEGRLQTRKWEDKEGNDRWTTEIVANEMQMLGERVSQSSSDNLSTTKRSSSEFTSDDFDDDIPF